MQSLLRHSKQISDRGGRIIAAFDADTDGRKLAEKLTRLVPQAECVVPTQAKDWNAQLLILRQSLRDWYRQARDLGRSPDHLNEIAQIGKDLVQAGKLPHESVWQTLSQDQEAWQQQAQTVAACARNILNAVGEPQAGGTLFAGKKYVLFAQDDQLYTLAENRGVQPTEDDRAFLPDSILTA